MCIRDSLYDGPLMEALLSLVGTVFMVLVIIGIPVDTTTEGYGDSARALAYEEPAPNASAYGLQEYEEQCAAAAAKSVKFNMGAVSYTHLDVYKRQVQHLLGHHAQHLQRGQLDLEQHQEHRHQRGQRPRLGSRGHVQRVRLHGDGHLQQREERLSLIHI